MDTKLSVFVGIIAVTNLVVTVELVRRRRLAANFALLWVGVGLVGLVLSAGRTLVDRIAHGVGVVYGTSLVFACGILFLSFVCMSLSMHVSRLTEKTEILAEELAIVRALVHNDPRPLDPPRTDAASPSVASTSLAREQA
ncbi:MAG TPA: DUF2304 domain-containing protein [Acidimicrobiales bacterium]